MTTSREFLELALSGEALTVDHLEALVKERVKEDEYIDYKSRALLTGKSSKEAARVVREYMSGFANSDGGVLIIGMEESEGRASAVTGCNPKDVGGDLEGWAARCVTGLGAYFNPPPKFEAVQCPTGEVLVCAVGRSFNLVPVVEAGRLAYQIRLGDQMLPVPEYLLADLVMGKRQRPVLEVVDLMANDFEKRATFLAGVEQYQCVLTLKLENTGLAWAEQSRWGLVAKWIEYKGFSKIRHQKPGESLLTQVEVVNPGEGLLWKGELLHIGDEAHIDSPFDIGYSQPRLSLPYRYRAHVLSYWWKAALYLTAKNGTPIWYQLSLQVDNETIAKLERNNWMLSKENGDFEVVKLYGQRPMVGLIPIEGAGSQ